MLYNEVNWDRLSERYSRWWRGELDSPLLYIATWPDPAAKLEPRPDDNDAARHWFMHPETRIARELRKAQHMRYYADGFPTIEIGRINIDQAAYYGCPAHFSRHTVWVEPVLESWDGWEDRIRFDEENELWQMTIKQAHLAVEMAAGEVAISTLGGFEGVLDNLSTMRGVDRALFDIIECPEQVLALERRFLEDFPRYYGALYDVLKANARGVSLWDFVLMTEGPAHCLQSDFSCMISAETYRELGLWYLEEQASMFRNTVYHMDGSNALQHLPMLLEIDDLDCVQFIYQVPEGKPLREWTHVLKTILKSGKRAEVFAWDPADVIPVLESVPAKGLKMNIFLPDAAQAEDLVARIGSLGYPTR